jgi:Predicted membrane protein
MCMGYVGWLVALFRSRAGAGLARWLAPAGRMALTNYLLQSVVCTLVFYNYGLGYFGQMPRAWQAVFALVLFVLQVIFSHAWLARFRFGPMEWLWRSATYLRPQPMRLRAQPAAGRA